MKKVLNISFTLLALAGLGVLLSFTGAKHKQMPCSEIVIMLDENHQNNLLCEEDIRRMLRKTNDSLVGRQSCEISIEPIESFIKQHPYVEDCDAYMTVNGILKLNIRQRNPLVRVFNENGSPFLVDGEGKIIPVMNSAVDVIVASGYIKEKFDFSNHPYYTLPENDHSTLPGIYHLARLLDQNEFLSSLIDQIYINREGEVELVPKVGGQLIVFGSFERMEKKLRDLEDVYKTVLPSKGWKKYSTVNLKYENQVICSK